MPAEPRPAGEPVVMEQPVRDATRKTGREDDCHLCKHHNHRQRTAKMEEGAVADRKGDEKTTETKPRGAGHRRGESIHGVDSEGYNKLFSDDDISEEAHGPAGRFVKKLGIFAYALFFVVPLTYVAIFFAIIPLGDPTRDEIGEQWVFIFISNTAVVLAISYLYNATFLSLAEEDRPFRTSLIPLVAIGLAEIAILAPLLLTIGVFDWLGIVALSVCYIALFGSMFVAYKDMRHKLHSFFRRFMLLLILFVPILVGYIIAYRETDSSVAQSGLSFAFAFVTFIYRRIMLSKLDPFPLDYSQLLSGFWVQNLSDSTLILAFPQVNSPSVFAAVFASNAFSNVAFLVFVSDPWIYKIRPVLKTYVKNAFKGNFPIPPIPKPDETFDPVNRGHDNNIGGYRRRQFRFFFFRLLSQAVAMFMYLGISPMLRFGLNKDFNPLGDVDGPNFITSDQYRNSMIYAGANLVFILLVGVLGYYFLQKRHHETFHEIREIHRHDFLHHTMVGLVTSIITHNMIFTIAIILSHYCIFASFEGCILR